MKKIILVSFLIIASAGLLLAYITLPVIANSNNALTEPLMPHRQSNTMISCVMSVHGQSSVMVCSSGGSGGGSPPGPWCDPSTYSGTACD